MGFLDNIQPVYTFSCCGDLGPALRTSVTAIDVKLQHKIQAARKQVRWEPLAEEHDRRKERDREKPPRNPERQGIAIPIIAQSLVETMYRRDTDSRVF